MSGRRGNAPGVPWRRRLLLALWLLAGTGLLARAFQVQVVQGSEWRRVAERQHQRTVDVPAPRGGVLDRDGAVLAASHERLRVAVAPREIRDPKGAAEVLTGALGLRPDEASRVVVSSDPWIVLPGHYPPAVREALADVRGIHLERELERVLPHGDLALGVLGRVREGQGRGGVEQAFDALLAGRTGQEVQARDNVGRPIPGESFMVRPPRSGAEVVLTLDLDLQEIGREALAQAVDETGAQGGDLLITDPRTGEILSLVSLRADGSTALTAIHTPYEPGSTLKPFTVAALLSRGLAALGDTVDGEGGRWRVAGRALTDVHPHGKISLADALRVSSNVGIAKAATALDPAEQYETLRDFGFGAPTGVELPGEAPGTLRKPEAWSSQSPASLAIGYEIAVTPIQMALAYGALANGGWLMEPRLVREVRDPDGTVLERRAPLKVRRVVRPEVAQALSEVLVDVVEDGTGTAARLASFRVAGKSGTSRAYSEDGGYERGGYFSSFVGFFPADDPQLVIFVKLERPEGPYYGGATAAPVTRATLEAVLAARGATLDRRTLVRAGKTSASPPPPPARFASYRLPLPSAERWGATPSLGSDDGEDRVTVPDLEGRSLRSAVRRLHALGFRVEWDGHGPGLRTRPKAGSRLAPGDTVRLGSGP